MDFSAIAASAKKHAEAGRTSISNRMNQNHSPAGAAPVEVDPSAAPVAPYRSHAAPPPPRAYGAPASSNAAGGTFANISPAEKLAFFGLLDEYFSTRPQHKALFNAAPVPGPKIKPTPPPSRASPPLVVAPPIRSRGIGEATALFDYEGGESTDLSFVEGDKIMVLEKVSDDWWKGELGGKEGIFPATYVQL